MAISDSKEFTVLLHRSLKICIPPVYRWEGGHQDCQVHDAYCDEDIGQGSTVDGYWAEKVKDATQWYYV